MIVKDLVLSRSTNTNVQFLKYIVVGAVAAIADISLLYLLTEFAGMHYLISAGAAFICGVIINYSLCLVWIFPASRHNTTKGFILFLIIGILGLILNEIIMFGLVSYLEIWYMTAKVVSTIIVLFWNFFARKKLVFL